MSENRILGEKVEINSANTKKFFLDQVKKDLHRYNYVIYQDDNPQLAIERDEYEKEKMLPYMNINSSSRILDIGCGVGRWGDTLSPLVSNGMYVGVDYTQQFIDIARECVGGNNTKFICGDFLSINEALISNGIKDKFDLILINGVLMYLNDEELEVCLMQVDDLLKHGGRVYIKESVAYENRLTLRDFYSSELKHEYSAIYRTIAEYDEVFKRIFCGSNASMEQVEGGATWPNDKENRKETTSWFWFYEKK